MKEKLEPEKQYFTAYYYSGVEEKLKRNFVMETSQESKFLGINKKYSDLKISRCDIPYFETISIAPIMFTDESKRKFVLAGPWEEMEYNKLCFNAWDWKFNTSNEK